MIGALADSIDAGRVKIFAVTALNAEGFYNRAAHPLHRSHVQTQYDDYVRSEAIPFVQYHCQSADLKRNPLSCADGETGLHGVSRAVQQLQFNGAKQAVIHPYSFYRRR